jgi:DNA-binding transcriptional LysR family regulator
VAIAVQRGVASHFVLERLATFARRHPKVHVVTRMGTIEEAIALLREHAVRLGLFLAAGPVAGIRSEVVAHEPLLLVASRKHALAGRSSVTPIDLSREAFVTGMRGSRYSELARAALKDIGLLRFDVAMELQEPAAVKEMVRHGAGVACLPRCTVGTELAAGSLVALKLVVPLQDLEVRCGYRPPLSGAARRLVQAIRGDR